MYNYLFNLFICLKNAQVANRSFILQPRKNICESFLKIIWKEGFILGYTICDRNLKIIKIFLKYKNNKSSISSIKIVSLSGRRLFYSISEIWSINSNKMFIIFSTQKGLNSITDCKKYKMGGEPYIILY